MTNSEVGEGESESGHEGMERGRKRRDRESNND